MSVLKTKIDSRPPDFQGRAQAMSALVAELRTSMAQITLGDWLMDAR